MKFSTLSLCVVMAAGRVFGVSSESIGVDRLLQDADNINITATTSTPAIDSTAEPELLEEEDMEATPSTPVIDSTVEPELLEEEDVETVEEDTESADDGADSPWRVSPQPLPPNYKLTVSLDPSNEDSIYAYTFAVAGEDASITSHTGSENSDEDDPVLYFKVENLYCDPTDTVPTSFMTSKFQVLDSDSPTLTKTERLCWKAPVGYYINEGNPNVHRLILQIYRETLNDPDIKWEYDGTISTIQGKGKPCAKLSFSLMQIKVVSQNISPSKLMFGITRKVKVVIH